MNPIAEEIASYLGSAEMTEEEFIKHYGKGHLDGGHSGRFPWGSGEDPYQHSIDFLGRIAKLKKEGWTETPDNIMKEFGLTSSEYRIEKSLCNDERRIARVSRAKDLRDAGYSNREIGRRMNVNESTVREWFDKEKEERMYKSRNTAEFLKKQVDEKRMIDVGKGVEAEDGLNISREKLNTALYMLESQGYHVYSGRVPQVTNVAGKATTQKVLARPEVEYKEIYDFKNVKTINEYISRDNGKTFEKKFTYPESLNSKRIKVRYKEEGGADKDGIVEIRRNVPDLDLKNSRYAQVRILVDGTHYIKGMALYSDNIPDGYDIVFNTSKKKGVPMMSPNKDDKQVLKPIKKDPENPFGSAIKDADKGGQYWYTDPKTGKKKLGLINKRADEGDWTEWTDSLPSQFLSKQTPQLAKKQLDLAKTIKLAEFDDYMSLENPTIKKYYLKKFADECDSAAVDLKAAALPGQKYHVIISNNTLKDNEVYAPGYASGSKLALIRYPHGGTFEIPICTVNNKNKLGKELIGPTSIDAICVNSKVAARLSGADFDGDTVMCIPTDRLKGKTKIISTAKHPLLEDFDPSQYAYDTAEYDSKGVLQYYRNGRKFKPMNNQLKQTEMGMVSNLITDMTLGGANENDIALAVRHSMVVIDAEKHKYDYKQSYIDHDIARIQKEWQPKYDKDGNMIRYGGANTIVSRSSGKYTVPKRRGEPKINVEYSEVTNKKGKPWYDPSKPEGAIVKRKNDWYDPNRPKGSLIYTTADPEELYYVVSKYNKKTHMRTITTTNGKKITYDMNDAEARDKYNPVMKKDPKTGMVTYTNKDGSITYRIAKRTQDSTKMAETDDAYTLLSNPNHPHPMEVLYADYANDMKALANRARIEMLNTPKLQYSAQAKKIYSKEVSSLEKQLNDAMKNKVKERTANRLAASDVKSRIEEDPDLTNGDIKKMSQRYVTKYRDEVGAIRRRDRNITISDREWEAIQAGAISENKLKTILDNTDPDNLRERAMPKSKTSISQAQINRIKGMANSDFTIEEIATKMNLSKSVVSKYLKE